MTCPKCKDSGTTKTTITEPHKKADGTVEIVTRPSTWEYCDCIKGLQAKVSDVEGSIG